MIRPQPSHRPVWLNLSLLAVICSALTLASCGKSSSGGGTASAANAGASSKATQTYVFVSNNTAQYWKVAEAGVEQAGRDLRVNASVQMPANANSVDQKNIIQAQIARGINGIAISPNDPANQTDLLNSVASQMPLVTVDSDAPQSNRACYVGTDNHELGMKVGKLIEQVLPNGGTIMMFIGRTDAQNAHDRIQGIKDELKGSKIQILGIKTDEADQAKAKSNAQDTIARYPNIGCLVGLYSYDGPAIVSAVQSAGKAGKLPIVCTDAAQGTLDAIKQGYIKATVAQQPFMMGYRSIEILNRLANKEPVNIPADKQFKIPSIVITKDTVGKFEATRKQRMAGQALVKPLGRPAAAGGGA